MNEDIVFARHALARLPDGDAKTRLAQELETISIEYDRWREVPPTEDAKLALHRRLVSLHVILAKVT